MKYCLLLILLVFFSCNQEEKFIQPQVLTEGSGFDLGLLTFQEDALKLVSKSLDTLNNDYSINNLEPALRPTKKKRENISRQKQLAYVAEGRYDFETFERDSIAQFLGRFFNEIEIETDTAFQIKAGWASTKFFNKVELDTFLHKMYKNYGRTIWMQDLKDKKGLQESLVVSYDKNGVMKQELMYEEYDIDYESYLYEYDINGEDFYQQWKLEDRILQIEISDGVESTIDFETKKIENNKYHRLELLILKNEEYDLIRNTLITKSNKNQYPARIVKPYYIEELDFYIHFGDYQTGTDANGYPTYEFK